MRALALSLALAVDVGLGPALGAAPAAADAPGGALLRFEDPEITEASGLVDLGDRLVTANDSGSGPVLHVVDVHTGATTKRLTYADRATDVEALAPGPADSVWVGDIGDNRRVRDSVQVYRVATAADAGPRPTTARFDLRYPDGAHDAESLFTGPDGHLYLVTKQLFGGGIYRAPALSSAGGTHRLHRVGDVSIFATDAAAVPGSSLVLVRGYRAAQVLDLVTGQVVGDFRLPRQPQGEAISVGPDDRILVTSEGVHAAVLEVRPPPWLRGAVADSRRTTAAAAGVETGAMLGR